MAQTALWVSTLVFAHLFALIWLLKSFWLSKTSGRPSSRDQSVNESKTGSSSSREAKGVVLTWQGIGCSYDRHGSTKVVLQGVQGTAHGGQMQAIIGPSGAGKSSLLDILAMRKCVGNISGHLLVNDKLATRSYLRSTSYVAQDDTFIPTLMCEETLSFYAAVLMPEAVARRKEQIQTVLHEMGLTRARNTMVGGALPGGLAVRGLSGGERRRLSIAVGILGSPSVLFLDEPTSGLDSFAALNVVKYLKHMAVTEQQVVICTIHQPRDAIWKMFDTVTLLASGRLMYHGPCHGMMPWFEALGYSLTMGSESDFVLDLVGIGFDKPLDMKTLQDTMRTQDDVNNASDAFAAAYTKGSVTVMPTSADTSGKTAAVEYPTSWLRQFTALAGRELASITRNPFDVAGRMLTAAWLAVMFGLVFYNMPVNSLDSIRIRLNFIFGLLLACCILPYISIGLYINDKHIHLADTSAKRYRLSAYYAAKLVVTTPFSVISTLCFAWIAYGMAGLREGGVHMAIFGAIMVICYLIAAQVLHFCVVLTTTQDSAFGGAVLWISVQVLFSSFLVSFEQVALYGITALRYMSAMYFGLEGLVQNEFNGTTFSCAGGVDSKFRGLLEGLSNTSPMQRTALRQLERPQPGCMINPGAVVDYLGYGRSVGATMGILFGYLGVLHVLTYIGLGVVARKEAR